VPPPPLPAFGAVPAAPALLPPVPLLDVPADVPPAPLPALVPPALLPDVPESPEAPFPALPPVVGGTSVPSSPPLHAPIEQAPATKKLSPKRENIMARSSASSGRSARRL
jgi:hypothetical protein